MKTFRLTVAYDGTNYFGWQAQKNRRSVQETLEAAVAGVTGQKVRLLSSGRTDAGVHALGQVASFRAETGLEPDELLRALNAVLPKDIVVREACGAPATFHPTRQALRKCYRYLIYNGPVRNVFYRHYNWHFNKGRLDTAAMHRAAQALLGTHDFSSFETSGAKRKTSVRTIFDIGVRRMNENGAGEGEGGMRNAECGMRNEDRAGEGRGEMRNAECGMRNKNRAGGECGFLGDFISASAKESWIIIEVEADGFLYNMVRAIVGALVEVGRGAQPEDWIAEVLRAADRRSAGPTAPPQGLFLMWVEYPESK